MSVYLKSQNDFIKIKNINSYKWYDFTIFPLNGRAIPVSNIDINYSSNTVTFNNIIRYNGTYETVINVSTNSTISDYFRNSYTGPRIYKNNLYENITTLIKTNNLKIDDPTSYLMYDSSGDQSIVTSIKDGQTYYRFTSSLGSIDFDKNSGLPFYTKFVVYKYDGYSHITKDFYDIVYNGLSNLQIKEGLSTTYQVYYYEDFIRNLKVYIIHKDRKTDIQSHKIYRNYTNRPLIFFAPNATTGAWADEGVSYYKSGGEVYSGFCVYRDVSRWVDNTTIPCAYRIYRKDFFSNFTPNLNSVFTFEQSRFLSYNKSISPTNSLNFTSPLPLLTFEITIPNDKPTNRILVYQTNNNKLLHITDYIARGTTQNVTISVTNNNGVLNVSSSVVPVNPLPVPNFWTKSTDNIASGGRTDKRWTSELNNECVDGELVQLLDKTKCYNIYTNLNIKPSSSVNWSQESQTVSLNENYDGNFLNCNKNRNGKVRSVKQWGYTNEYGVNQSTYYSNTSAEATCVYPSITIPRDYNPAISWSKNPINPIQCGGSEEYVCRANHEGYNIPGRFINGTCFYGYGGAKGNSTDYELASSNFPLTFKDKTQVEVSKKIEGGINQDGTVSYICRFSLDGNLIAGKEVNNICFVNYKGEEKSSTSYQLLTYV